MDRFPNLCLRANTQPWIGFLANLFFQDVTDFSTRGIIYVFVVLLQVHYVSVLMNLSMYSVAEL